MIDQFGYPALQTKGEAAIEALQLQALTDREKEPLDDYRRLEVSTKRELIELYQRNFFFGCEADDPGNAWAFDARMPGRLKAILGSDVSHYDVSDFSEVMPEVYELVEDGLINEEDLREFVFSNAVEALKRLDLVPVA